MTEHNREYYVSRASAERAKADASINPSVAALHRDLAELYDKKLQQGDDDQTLYIATA